MSDKGDRSDKESEKSSMKVIGKGLWKPCHSCHSCHGRCVDRAADVTALTLDVMWLANHEGGQSLPMTAFLNKLLIEWRNKCLLFIAYFYF